MYVDFKDFFVVCTSLSFERPTPEKYKPVPTTSLPDIGNLLAEMKKEIPDARAIKLWEVTDSKTSEPLTINVKSPLEIIQSHVCLSGCSCATEVLNSFKRSADERRNVEKATRGQQSNPIWHKMRHGLVTASKVKAIISSKNLENTACSILKVSSLNEDHLPPSIQFGRDNEKKAIDLFFRAHRFSHRKCKFHQPGFFLSYKYPYLGASPDAIGNCPQCGRFIVEVKCLFSLRDHHPKTALLQQSFAFKNDSGKFELKKSHSYYMQIQTQMAVTGIRKAFLCIFTCKGIAEVECSFEEEFWKVSSRKLESFWINHLFPKLRE